MLSQLLRALFRTLRFGLVKRFLMFLNRLLLIGNCLILLQKCLFSCCQLLFKLILPGKQALFFIFALFKSDRGQRLFTVKLANDRRGIQNLLLQLIFDD